MKKKIAVFIAVAVLSIIAGIFLGARKTVPSAAKPSAVEALLSQSMVDTSGHPQSLTQWKGKTLVVNFWATWCTPCVDEMPELSALQAELSPHDIQILGIGIDSAANIANFASKYKISYPLYVAGMGATEISRELGNKAGGLPFTILISRDGQVKKTYLGRLKMDELRQDLKAI